MSGRNTLRQIADEYFASLSPLCARIVGDIQAIKDNYEDAWDELSLQEQLEAVDENIIFPDAVLRYTLESSKYPLLQEINQKSLPSSFPKLAFSPGSKIVTDENDKNCRWRDEHSAPFSWETRSQLDCELLSPIIHNEHEITRHVLSSPRSKIMPKPRPMTIEFEHPSIVLGGSCVPDATMFPSLNEVQVPVATFPPSPNATTNAKSKPKVVKPSSPPPLPPPKDVQQTSEIIAVVEDKRNVRDILPSFGSDYGCRLSVFKETDSDLPKTGCEFLDNW